MTVTGERVTTPERGFNPTWQRHVAAYRLAGTMLGPGNVLDLGCGVGHSYRLLEPRETVGVDLSAEALEGQGRETVKADMRALPFAAGSFASVLSVHSLEHVPDAERALAEAARVLAGDGKAVFVTPNRLTFGRADEIIDPYHYVEYDPLQLEAVCAPFFEEVRVGGIFGSERYQALLDEQRLKLDRLLAKDPLRLRRLAPRRMLQLLYDRRLTAERSHADVRADAIAVEDFSFARSGLDGCLDLVAECTSPRLAATKPAR